MRSAILLLVLSGAILGSCTSAYKTGQTPDDVYFSPERPQDKYVAVKDDENRYQGDDYYYDDQYLRMKVHNRMMWSDLDDPYFYNPRYSYSYYNNWSNPWSPYTYWNYYYNPYCSPVIYTPKTVIASNHPRVFNLNTYNNAQLANNNYTNPKGSLNNNSYNYSSKPARIVGYTPSNNNSSSGAGNFLRNIFNSSSNNNSSSGSSNSSFSSGSRSSSSGSGSSGSSGGGGGGSAPGRRF
jgi:uncharacterized membrane protein YgcG